MIELMHYDDESYSLLLRMKLASVLLLFCAGISQGGPQRSWPQEPDQEDTD